MIIAARVRFDFDQFLLFACSVSWIATGIFFLLFLKWFSSDVSLNEEEYLTAKTAQNRSNMQKTYHLIGKGPMALKGQGLTPVQVLLQRDLVIFTKKNYENQSKSYLVGLKTSGQGKFYSLEEMVHITATREEPSTKFSFSEAPSNCRIQFLNEKNGQISLNLQTFDSERMEMVQIPLQPSSVENIGRYHKILDADREAYHVLRSAKCWGVDILMNKYGGTSFDHAKKKMRLEFFEKDVAYLLFVKENDILIYESGRWKHQTIGREKNPLVRIKTINSHLEIEAFDSSGFCLFELKYLFQKPSKTLANPQQIFRSLKLRNHSQVSCFLGKQRMVLKPGDWILKSKNFWKKIKSGQELDQYLSYFSRGDLFIFDGLEKRGNQLFLTGHFFDEMRTQCEKIALPVGREEKTHAKGKMK
ncbi:MAG: hypothetical protein L0207_04660 [Chlamydiae bacterium]|nr:hypothetical protein [Chlamydiota bacterium]